MGLLQMISVGRRSSLRGWQQMARQYLKVGDNGAISLESHGEESG